mgnify:CR=1 FL=1
MTGPTRYIGKPELRAALEWMETHEDVSLYDQRFWAFVEGWRWRDRSGDVAPAEMVERAIGVARRGDEE